MNLEQMEAVARKARVVTMAVDTTDILALIAVAKAAQKFMDSIAVFVDCAGTEEKTLREALQALKDAP